MVLTRVCSPPPPPLPYCSAVLSKLQAQSLPTEAAVRATRPPHHQCVGLPPPTIQHVQQLSRVELLTCCDPNQLLYLPISTAGRTLQPPQSVLHCIICKVQCARTKIGKGWGRATRILTAFDGASSDLLLSGLALSGRGYFWQKPPVVSESELRGCHGNSKSYHCCAPPTMALCL